MNKNINEIIKKILKRIDIYDLYLVLASLKTGKKDIKNLLLENIYINYDEIIEEDSYINLPNNNKELYDIYLTLLEYDAIQIDDNGMAVITNFGLELYKKISFLTFITAYTTIE